MMAKIKDKMNKVCSNACILSLHYIFQQLYCFIFQFLLVFHKYMGTTFSGLFSQGEKKLQDSASGLVPTTGSSFNRKFNLDGKGDDGPLGKVIGKGKSLGLAQETESAAIDQASGSFIQSKTLKIIYQSILNLSYSLFVAGFAVVATIDKGTIDAFVCYLQQPSSISYIVVLVVLAILIFGIYKLYSENDEFSSLTRRNLNFIEDNLRMLVFIIVLIFAQPFIFANGSVTMFCAFGIYVLSAFLFVMVRFIKWGYYLCGHGRHNLKPWRHLDKKDIDKLLNNQQIGQLKKLLEDALNKKPKDVYQDIKTVQIQCKSTK